MNPFRITSIAGVIAVASLSGLPGNAAAQGTITINGCASLTLVSGTTFTCNTTPVPPPPPPAPNGPTGCSVTPSTTSLPVGGGNVTLSAGCTGGAALTGVTWTRNGALFNGTFPDALPANSGASTVSYAYQATFNWAGTPAPTASATATVAAAVAPAPTPTGGPIVCAGYNVRTVDYTIPASGNQDFSAPMSPGEVVIGRFRTPATPDTQINLGYMYNAGATILRTFRLSKDACDLGTTPGPNAVASTQAKSVIYTVSVGPGQTKQLLPDTTYYFHVRGEVYSPLSGTTVTCVSGGTPCGGFFQVQR
jgi:hypothetical protein